MTINPKLGRVPIWEDLPIHFRIDVVTYLDVKSKHRLLQCSKVDKFAVEKAPLVIRLLTIEELPKKFLRKQKYMFVNTEGDHTSVDAKVKRDEVAKKFMSIMLHRNSIMEKLSLKCNPKIPEKMIKAVHKAGIRVCWKVEALKLRISVDHLIEFMSFFDRKYFKEVHLSVTGPRKKPKKSENVDYSEVFSLLKDFKNLALLSIPEEIQGPLECVSTARQLDYWATLIDPQDLANYVKGFQANCSVGGSFFEITTETIMNDKFWRDVVHCFDPIRVQLFHNPGRRETKVIALKHQTEENSYIMFSYCSFAIYGGFVPNLSIESFAEMIERRHIRFRAIF